MNEEEKDQHERDIRFRCLELAIKSGVNPDEVVAKSKDYYEFITTPWNI